MVGAWEHFLREMVEEHFQQLTLARGVQRSRLPMKLQTTAVWNSLKIALDGPPFIQTTRQVRIPAVVQASQLTVNDDVDPSALSVMRSNPKGRVVREMFADLGISDIWAVIQPAFTTKWRSPIGSLSDQIDAIVDYRHIAAHTPRVLAIARRDLTNSVQLLNTVGDVLDEYVDRYCQATAAACVVTTTTPATPVGLQRT